MAKNKKRGYRARAGTAAKPLAAFGDAVMLRRYAVAGGILLFALAAARFDASPFARNVAFQWYLNYDCGYVARGLLGTIIKFLHGGFLPLEEMDSLARAVKGVTLPLTMLLLWLLLAPRVLHIKLSPRAVWFLLSFVALALLSPLWKALSFQVALMDDFVFLCALSAMATLIGRRPLLFALCLIAGFMFHRLMFAYAVLLSLMAAHACMFNPPHAARRRFWLAAAGGAWAVIFLLLTLADNANSLCSLEDAPLPPGDGNRTVFTTTQNFNAILSSTLNKWTLYLPAVVPAFVYFFAPALLAAALFIWGCGKAGIRAPAAVSGGRAARLLTDGRWFPLLAVFCTLPLHLVAVDTIRVFYWSWFGFALSLVYGVWFFAAEDGASAKPAPKKKARAPAPLWIAAFIALSSYAYAGAPLLWGNIAFPNLLTFPCRAWCAYPLTVNPLGAWWHARVTEGMRHAIAPFTADGEQLRSLYLLESELRGLRAEGGVMHVPAAYEGELFPNSLILAAGETYTYRVRHGGGSPPLYMVLEVRGDKPHTFAVPPAAEEGGIVWSGRAMSDGAHIFHLYTRGGADFTIKEVALDFAR